MVTRSRHTAVLEKNQWQSAFGRQTTIEEVLRYMIKHWYILQKKNPAHMRFSELEPRITKHYAASLFKNSRDQGIYGIFIPEYPNAELDEVNQQMRYQGRTDITYFNDRVEPRVQIDIEFKKLKPDPGAKASRGSYFKDGVLRFVNGIYAKDTEVGFMIGLIEHSTMRDEIVGGIRQSIQEGATSQLLRMLSAKNGSTIISPCDIFPSCEFETRHARDHIPNRNDVLVGHFFLSHQESS